MRGLVIRLRFRVLDVVEVQEKTVDNQKAAVNQAPLVRSRRQSCVRRFCQPLGFCCDPGAAESAARQNQYFRIYLERHNGV